MVRVWVAAARPRTLLASVAPVLAGAALGGNAAGAVRWDTALLCLLGAVLIQVGTNFANDAFDFYSGADDAGRRVGPTRAVAAGLIRPQTMLTASVVVLGLALVVGLSLAAVGGWPILVLGLVSLLCALAYTGGPVPLAYVGLGDLFVFLFFGLFAVLGTAWLQALVLPTAWWWVAAALGCQATAIIAVNNIRDREGDAEVGKRTLAVLLGDRIARHYHAVLHLVAVACLWQAFDATAPALIAAIGGFVASSAVLRLAPERLDPLLALDALTEMATAIAIAVVAWP